MNVKSAAIVPAYAKTREMNRCTSSIPTLVREMKADSLTRISSTLTVFPSLDVHIPAFCKVKNIMTSNMPIIAEVYWLVN